MRGKWLLVSVSVIALACAAGAILLLRHEPRKPAPVPVATVLPASDLNLPGKIQAEHVVPVGVAFAGTIESFLVEVGQDVSEGQLLARISNQGLESARQDAALSTQNAQEKVNLIESRIVAARLAASRGRSDANRSRDQFTRAESVYLRQQMLNREGATPRLVYEKSEREFEAARTEFNSLDELARQAENRVSDLMRDRDAARRSLDERNAELEIVTAQTAGSEVRSPINGVLVARAGEPGKFIGPEEAKELLQIAVDLSQLIVVIQPDPPVLKRIRVGQDALLFVADFPGATPSKVKEIRSSDVVLEFTNPTPVIRPGMTAQVRLKLE
jgi:HlyD family secretion protein